VFTNWNLQDCANLAQIIGLLALPLSVVLWYFTKEHFNSFWRNWRKPIFWILACAAGLAAAVTAARHGWLTKQVQLPVWIFVLSLALVLAVLWVAYLLIEALGSKTPARRTFTPRSPGPPQSVPHQTAFPPEREPGPLDYKGDDIFGVSWSWDYWGHTINDSTITAFCPLDKCRCRLDWKDDYERLIHTGGYHGATTPTTLICPNCGLSQAMQWDSRELRRRVALEIERRLNTGEFMKQLKGKRAT
jgi:hypothetical protein